MLPIINVCDKVQQVRNKRESIKEMEKAWAQKVAFLRYRKTILLIRYIPYIDALLIWSEFYK